MSGIVPGAAIAADVDVACDVCIVGSGAGGAVLAAGLCKRGLSVVMLEEGGYHTKADFDLQEGHAYPMLYQERGGRATTDQSITILQGRSVGGSTTVNWTTCFRTPDRILELWREKYGIEGLDPGVLAPHFEAVEERLGIHTWPVENINENNRVLWDGCGKLGWAREPLRRNVRNCVSSGYCGMGCPVDAKQAMHLTYLPDAVNAGLTLYASTRVDRLELEGNRVVAVHGTVIDPGNDAPTGRRVLVRPNVAVSSAGAINGPALLLRSGLNQSGRVGKRTFLHPVVASIGIHDRAINGFYGAPQSVSSHHFIDRGPGKVGFFMELAPVHPMLAATASPAFGAEMQEQMAKLAHFSTAIALSVDGLVDGDEGGTVSLRGDGRIGIDYPVREALQESFRESQKAMARVQLAAGATEVRTLHMNQVVLRSEADLPLLDKADFGALKVRIFTAHQMGGCAMGKDPRTSVVDPTLRHHQVHNLYVVDGSVFPTALGVNPSESIYGLADWAVDKVASAV